MDIDQTYFRTILGELAEENPLACQGILSVSGVEFTTSVPTLAVTLNTDRPRLLVNLDFVREHCREEVHVKAVLLHEFLHVLLNHTGDYEVADAATNLALDAVINHIIHRSCGAKYSEFFRIYYAEKEGWIRLLAPAADHKTLWENWDPALNGGPLETLQKNLFLGRVLADDILDLAREAEGDGSPLIPEGGFLGNHDPGLQAQKGGRLQKLVREALDNTFRQLNGSGVFRDPADHGFATPHIADAEWRAREERVQRWERVALAALRPLLIPDPNSQRFEFGDRRSFLPVLNSSDRRGSLRWLWSPLLPEIAWDLPERKPAGTTVVYLDVSGSMNAEMGALIALLSRLRKWIRLPFWAFSDEVAPATIEGGVLRTETTGGTAMNCVLRHLAETRAEKALVVTDGYIEACDPALLEAAKGTSLHALVSRDGSTARLEEAGIACTQLCEFPN